MKKFIKEPFSFPKAFWYRKKYMDKRGHITIFYRNFVVSQYQETSSGNPSVYVPEKRGGEYHNFSTNFFCLTVPKNFVGKPFSDS